MEQTEGPDPYQASTQNYSDYGSGVGAGAGQRYGNLGDRSNNERQQENAPMDSLRQSHGQSRTSWRPVSASVNGRDSRSSAGAPVSQQSSALGYADHRERVMSPRIVEKPKVRPMPIDERFLLAPTAPFSAVKRGERTNSNTKSPVIPPLSFGDGGSGTLGIRTEGEEEERPLEIRKERPLEIRKEKPRETRKEKVVETPSPRPLKNPARKNRWSGAELSVSTVSSELTPAGSPQPSPVWSFVPSEFRPDAEPENSPQAFHALTAEEPIVLPPSTQSSGPSSPEFAGRMNGSTSKPPSVSSRAGSASSTRSSFLGGWKLAMRSLSGRGDDDKNTADGENAPVGVGSGGGWIQRRRGSFSTPRPPSAERAQHRSYAQEYKEFRASKAKAAGTENDASARKRVSDPVRTPGAPVVPPEGTRDVGGVTADRKSWGQKLKHVEQRLQHKKGMSAPAAAKSTDIAPVPEPKDIPRPEQHTRHMSMPSASYTDPQPVANTVIKTPARPVSDIHSAAISMLTNGTKPHHVPAELPIASSSRIAPQPASNHSSHPKPHHIVSPLCNEVGDSPSGLTKELSPTREAKGKGPAPYHFPATMSSPTVAAGATAIKTSLPSTRPKTPPKPIAKLFVICCRCKVYITPTTPRFTPHYVIYGELY